MATGIASRVGIDADKLKLVSLEAGLLPQFPAARGLHALADLDEAAWQRERALVGLVLPADQKDPARAVEDDAVGCKKWCFRA
jgi:hypothetical protein